MGWEEINLAKYVAEIKRNMEIEVSDEIIKKDLLLTLILAEFQKLKVGKELIFKGGTLLSRNYLKYHRFSEDLDFVYRSSETIRKLPRSAMERKIKKFLDYFVPELKKVADTLGLDFDSMRSNKRYCTIMPGKTVYIFRVYYSKEHSIKIEINFLEKIFDRPRRVSVKAITDYFASRDLLKILGLELENFSVLSYTLNEITLEKYRAVLTRKLLMERDLFDLYLIPNSLKVNTKKAVKKIENASMIKNELKTHISENLRLLEEDKFFNSEEKIEVLAIIKYKPEDFRQFKEKIKPIIIEICRLFLKK